MTPLSLLDQESGLTKVGIGKHETAFAASTLTAAVSEALGSVNVKVAVSEAPVVSPYPPTLFSDANYQASCEGMAGRDMKNFAGDIGYQMFYQGIYLVLIAIATGFLKLAGFCSRRDAVGQGTQYLEAKFDRGGSVPASARVLGHGAPPPMFA
jgi:hypothetical protein